MIKMKLLALLLVIAVSACSGKSVEGPRRALVNIQGDEVSGKLLLEQASINSPVKIRGVIYGLEPGLHSLHVHASTTLGANCENVGQQLVLAEKREQSERPAGHLGNVKTFSGSPSRTDINLISSLVSLFEEDSRSILNRALVIHVLPDDRQQQSANKQQQWSASEESRVLACGLIRPSAELEGARSQERESILLNLERPYKVDKIEQSILDGEKTWENVRHPYYGSSEEQRRQQQQKVPSNLNVDGVERPDLKADSLTLESAVPTRKVWKAGYTYEYDYAGWLSTGIAGVSPKVSGGAIKGRLVIEPVDESILNIALLKTEAKQFNEDVMQKFEEADPGQEVRILDQQFLEKPFQVKLISGKVESVAIGKEEPLWIVNFKRALAAQIQLQLDGTSGVFQQDDFQNYYAENAVYHALEGSSSGECQTWYHISRLPQEQIEAEQQKLLPVPELCQGLPVYEIVKNRDFDKCRILPIYNYQSTPGQQCSLINAAGCENAQSHIDHARIIGCTTQEGHFIVQRIKAVDKLVVKPLGYETEAAEGQTVQQLELKSVRQSGSSKLISRISYDVHAYQTLAYAFDSDYKTQGPLMGKPTLRSVNSPLVMEVDQQTLKQEAQRLLQEIVQDLQSEAFYVDPSSKYVPDKIDMLRRVFGSLDYPELVAFVQQALQGDAQSTQSQIVVDTLVLTGTNPAFLVLRDLITQGRLAGEQAVQAVAALPGTIETPTKELLASFVDLLKSQAVQSQRQLKITAALSASRLVYQACVNATQSLNMFPKLVMGEFCNPSDSVVAAQLVPYLAEQVQQAQDAGERIAFLTALGNVGHEMIIPYVKPYIVSCEPGSHEEREWYERNQRELSSLSKKEMRKKWIESKKTLQKELEEERAQQKQSRFDAEEDWEDQALCNIVRAKAIFALSSLALDQSEPVQTLLLPVFFNKAEETEVRLAALTLLFASQPVQAFWNRVALSTWYEPNDQISHFIYTTIASKAANKDALRREETVRAEAALPLMKPMFWTSYVATNYQQAGYSEQSRLGYLAQTINFPGFESFVPSHHFQSLAIQMGPWVSRLAEWSVDSKHAEKFVDRLLGKPNLRQKSNKDEESITSPEMKKIREQLQIEARATGQPELFIYLNLLDNYQRFYAITPQSVIQVVEKQLLQKLRQGPAGQQLNYHKLLPLYDSFRRIPSAMGLAYSVVGQLSVFVSVKSAAQLTVERSLTGQLQAAIQPVVQLHSVSKVIGELPFARAYPLAGVHFDVSLALPGRLSIEGDLKNGKVQASWEFQGQKVRVAHSGVTPYTAIKQVGDFTPVLLADNFQIASVSEQPQQERYQLGQQALGLNFQFERQGDQHALKAPQPYSEDLLGLLTLFALPSTVRQYNQSLVLDVAQSETKVVKTLFSFSAKSFQESRQQQTSQQQHLHSKSLFDTVYGDKIKSSQYIKEQDDEWQNQKFQHIFKSMQNPTGYSLDFTAEFVPRSQQIKSRRFGSSIVYAVDARSHKGSIMMEKRHEQQQQKDQEQNFVFCAEVDAQLPESLVFKRKELIKDEQERTSTIKIGFGQSCTDDRKIQIQAQWSRSEEQIPRTLRAKWQESQCRKQEMYGRDHSDECDAARRLSAVLNKAVVTIDYNQMPALVQNATIKASNLFRYWYGPYMSDNQVQVQNQQNQIRIESLYYPLAGVMDVKFFKPQSNTFFRGIEVHPVAEVVLPKRMAVPRPVLAGPGVCVVGKETVTTFDGLLYNATLSGCDQLLTKDCSGRYQLAVLSREENDQKVVTVLLDQEKVELIPAQQKVKINGKELSVSQQQEIVLKDSQSQQAIATIKKTADNFIQIDSPVSHMIRVLTDGQQVVVLGSPIHRGRLCGLCGSQTGNKATDLTGPRQCTIPRDLMEAAYELKQQPAGCKSQIPSAKHQEVRRIQEQCQKEQSETVFGISDATPLLPRFQQNVLSSQTQRRPSQWTVYRNKVIVEGSKRCFSTQSVPKCVDGSRPTETEERKLGFHCIERQQLSDKLNEELFRRPLDELQGKEVDTIRVFSVPTVCVPY